MDFIEHEIEWTDEKVSRMWNFYQQAPSASDLYFGFQNGGYIGHLLNSKLNLARMNKILDFSCGRGDIINACLPYLNKGQQIYGTDFSRLSVDLVNERFKDAEQFGEAVFTDSFPTSFSDDQFDLVISTEVIEHLRDDEIESMLSEAHRLLRPNGHIFITTPNNENRDVNTVLCPDCGSKFHRWQHLRSWTAESLSAKMEQHGFRTNHVITTAWGETPFRRLVFKFAAKINMKVETGLIYIGQKAASSNP